jgi:succinate dehydrogenase hydrophobic anchor subunit
MCLVLQLIIGLKYEDKCPVNKRIPHYLVVAGAVGLTLSGLSLAQIMLRICDVFKSDASASITKRLVRGISIVVFLLNIFIFAWFIAGCVWVFGAWNKVQYKRPNRTNYCSSTLYRFAFWLLLLSILYHLFTCCRSCTQLNESSNKKKKSGAIPVPTTEP